MRSVCRKGSERQRHWSAQAGLSLAETLIAGGLFVVLSLGVARMFGGVGASLQFSRSIAGWTTVIHSTREQVASVYNNVITSQSGDNPAFQQCAWGVPGAEDQKGCQAGTKLPINFYAYVDGKRVRIAGREQDPVRYASTGELCPSGEKPSAVCPFEVRAFATALCSGNAESCTRAVAFFVGFEILQVVGVRGQPGRADTQPMKSRQDGFQIAVSEMEMLREQTCKPGERQTAQDEYGMIACGKASGRCPENQIMTGIATNGSPICEDRGYAYDCMGNGKGVQIGSESSGKPRCGRRDWPIPNQCAWGTLSKENPQCPGPDMMVRAIKKKCKEVPVPTDKDDLEARAKYYADPCVIGCCAEWMLQCCSN